MNPIHTVLGTGPLARATARSLEQRGVPVRLLSRSGDPGDLPSAQRLDLLDTAALSAALAGTPVVYFCAQPAYHRWPEDFPPLLDSVVTACSRADCALVHGDNLYPYGDAAPDRPLAETSAADATTRKGRVRAAMATALLAAHAEGRLRVAIARGSDFFGPWVTASALGRSVFDPLLRGGTVRVPGDPDQPHAYTYIEDFGTSLATLGLAGRGWGEVWHVPNSPAISPRELVRRAATLAGVAPPKIAGYGRVSLAVAGVFMPAARETIELLPHFQRPYRVDDAKWRGRMPGVETPLDDALARTIAWYRDPVPHPFDANRSARKS